MLDGRSSVLIGRLTSGRSPRQVEHAVDVDAGRDDDLGIEVADLDDLRPPATMVVAAAVAITGPKLRAVLR